MHFSNMINNQIVKEYLLWFLASLYIAMGELQEIFWSLVVKKRNLFLHLLFGLLLGLVKLLVLQMNQQII